MIPEEERLAVLGVAGKHYARDPGLHTLRELEDAALAYARPIVAEECAVLVDGFQAPIGPEGDLVANIARAARDCANVNLSKATAAIREHGKEK